MASTATMERTRSDRLLDGVERVGNKLPDPFILFLSLFLVVGVVSTAMAVTGAEVQVPGAKEVTQIRGLFTGEGLTWLTTNVGENFIGFPPLATVLTILLAVTVAERTGLLGAAIRVTLGSAPRWLLPYAVGFVGVTSSVMADASMIVVPPLAAMVFKAAGRHPVAGLIGGFAAAGAGYSTSPLVTSLDALFAGITNAVTVGLPNPGTTVNPLSNYFFNLAASIVLALLAGFIIDRVIEPRMVRQNVPTEQVDEVDEGLSSSDDEASSALSSNASALSSTLEPREKRALAISTVVLGAIIAAMLVAFLLPGSPWRNEDGGFLPKSPLLSSVVFIVLAFILGQFIALFSWTGVGSFIAVGGAKGLERIGLTGFPAVLCFIVLCSLLNLFIVSGSSMWTLMGAVFVPLFALLGFEPAFIQGAFRVGDSATQVITPMNPYLFIFLMMLKRYEPKAGLGTVISRMLPFVVPFWIAWVVILAVFYFLGLDMGPGVGIRIN